MNLYLIRHGDAESVSSSKSDHERGLTQKGQEQIKKAADAWKKNIHGFDLIASSPYKRAHQTAEIIAHVFNYHDKVITDKKLASGCKPEDLLDFIKSRDEKNIAVVGHEPDLSKGVSALVSSSGMYCEFKKGTIAKINFDGKVRLGKGLLEFLIPQDIL